MTPGPSYGTPAGDAFLAIQKLARTSGGDVQELLTLYALEGILTRVALSPYRGDFVLKGGVLLAAFNLRRPTRDIDLQSSNLANDVESVVARVQEIVTLHVDDGLTFDPQQVTAQTIRDDDPYAGVRIRLVGMLGISRLSVGIDINFGDPIMPPPAQITLPRLLKSDQDPVQMLGYPLAMVIAEKTVTAMERGEANTRWRDFADVLTISNQHQMAASELRTALNAVADYRNTALVPLLPALSAMAQTVQPKWANWRRRQEHTEALPEQFSEVLERLAAFVDPVLNPTTSDTARWNPEGHAWED